MSAMERTEEAANANSNNNIGNNNNNQQQQQSLQEGQQEEESEEDKREKEGNFSTIHWLWVHISSQLIYFVLFQFASFPNIVQTLHDKVSSHIFYIQPSVNEKLN